MYIQRFHTYQETVLEHESGVHTGQRQVWGQTGLKGGTQKNLTRTQHLSFTHVHRERERENGNSGVCVCVCVCVCVVCCVRVPMCVYFLCE